MSWLKKFGPENRSLKEINAQFAQMLEDGRHIFDTSANALLGGTDPEVIREDLFRTDQRINKTEQTIRREIVVHGSIHGSSTFPELLILMSLVKDAERIGDYCKNIYNLACLRPSLGDAAQRQELIEFKDSVSRLIVKTHGIFINQNKSQANAFLAESGKLTTACDAHIASALKVTGENMGAQVLAYRYFKRVVSHASNIISSVVMPLDLLDYFDEPRK